MESGAVNNFHVIVKQITKFDGMGADIFLEWDSKLRASLSVYNKNEFQRLIRARVAVRIRCRSGDHSRDLGCRQSKPIQRALLHHS